MAADFEDFSQCSAKPPPESGVVAAGANAKSSAERFGALFASVEAAVRGDFSIGLPLGGNDKLTLLARNLGTLFALARRNGADVPPPAQATGTGAAQSDLMRVNARLEYLIANTPSIIYSSVPTGDFKMTFVSDNAARVLGYRPQDMVADPNFWFEHIHPDDIPSIFSSLALLFTKGKQIYEYRFKTSDGRYLWMHDTLRLIRDADGNPLEVVGSLTDITDRKLMEEALKKKGLEQELLIDQLAQAQGQLLQSEKMAAVGQLAAGVAHEINNPIGFVNSNLGTLKGYVEQLLGLIDTYERCTGAASAAESAMLKVARESADLAFLRDDLVALLAESRDGLDRVKKIVQDLRDFSRIDTTECETADLNAGLESTLNVARNELKYKAEVIKNYGKPPPVRCHLGQINQVILNLLVNAAQAIEGRGTITITSGAEGAWAWVRIADTGKGMEPEVLKRIFEPFFTTKPVGKGTGLGLSLAYDIVKKHGGRIDVSSEPGRGTCFQVWLPAAGPENSTH